ncbi:MAG: hypothetical protein JO091_06360 [Acidobacteriaceae bacterium]|nr:hypothetical protein [Acidobacteriaceae bacterium]
MKISAVILVFLLLGALLVLATKWPFTRQVTLESLERVTSSDVKIGAFRQTFLPYPGYVAQDVTFTRGASGVPPIASIRQIACRTTWFTLISFTHRIQRMDLAGVQVYLPRPVPPAIQKHPELKIKAVVTELVANGAILDIASSHAGGQPLRFEFPRLILRNVAGNKAIKFETAVHNPKPPGELNVSGVVGPLALGHVGESPLSASFRLTHADLGSFKLIAGDLSAKGRLEGRLASAQVAGAVEIPNFGVTRSRHSLGLTAEYRAVVNGINGDVVLKSAQAHFLQTTVMAQGAISGEPTKTASLDLESSAGRIQDVLRLFVTADRPPLNGALAFRAHVTLPTGNRPFIKRVQLDGDFTISGAGFTSAPRQQKVDELSARARGEAGQLKSSTGPKRVAEDLMGTLKLRDGIASVPAALFAVPGAVVRGGGTYNVITEAIDLRGDLAMHASLSKAVGGFKSVLLVPLDPIFKKHGAGAVLPVRIGGTYSHPVFKLSLH